MAALAGCGILMAIVAVYVFLALPLMLRYRLTDTAIIVSVFGIPSYKIPFEDIAQIRKCSTWFDKELNSDFFALRLGNTVFFKSYLIISQKKGLQKQVAITPKNPEIYISKFQSFAATQKSSAP